VAVFVRSTRPWVWEESRGRAEITRQAVRISKWAVWEAYQKVKANKGAPGVDEVSIEEFEKDLKLVLAAVLIMVMAARGACDADRRLNDWPSPRRGY
jgi:hypothetical protein